MRHVINNQDDHLKSVVFLMTRLDADASKVQNATGVHLGTVIQNVATLGKC